MPSKMQCWLNNGFVLREEPPTEWKIYVRGILKAFLSMTRPQSISSSLTITYLCFEFTFYKFTFKSYAQKDTHTKTCLRWRQCNSCFHRCYTQHVVIMGITLIVHPHPGTVLGLLLKSPNRPEKVIFQVRKLTCILSIRNIWNYQYYKLL